MAAQLAAPPRWCVIEPFPYPDSTPQAQTWLARGGRVRGMISFTVAIASGRPVLRVITDDRNEPIARLVGEATAALAERLERFADKDGDLFTISIDIWTEPPGYWKWGTELIFDGFELPPRLDAIRRDCQKAIEQIIHVAVVAGEFP